MMTNYCWHPTKSAYTSYLGTAGNGRQNQVYPDISVTQEITEKPDVPGECCDRKGANLRIPDSWAPRISSYIIETTYRHSE